MAFQASLSMGFFRQEYWSGVPGPPPGDLPNPGTELVSHVSCTCRASDRGLSCRPSARGPTQAGEKLLEGPPQRLTGPWLQESRRGRNWEWGFPESVERETRRAEAWRRRGLWGGGPGSPRTSAPAALTGHPHPPGTAHAPRPGPRGSPGRPHSEPPDTKH